MKIYTILKWDPEQIERAENKRQQVFPAQWEVILLEQVAPYIKTNANTLMLTLLSQSYMPFEEDIKYTNPYTMSF